MTEPDKIHLSHSIFSKYSYHLNCKIWERKKKKKKLSRRRGNFETLRKRASERERKKKWYAIFRTHQQVDKLWELHFSLQPNRKISSMVFLCRSMIDSMLLWLLRYVLPLCRVLSVMWFSTKWNFIWLMNRELIKLEPVPCLPPVSTII